MEWEIIRNIILIIGWPVLIIGSTILVYRNIKLYRSLGATWGKYIVALLTGWVVTMYCLAFSATLFMLKDPGVGPKIVLPIFIVWFVLMVVIIRKGSLWGQETQKMTSFYKELDKQVGIRTKQLSEEKIRFIASINALNIGYLMTDALDRVIYSNPRLWEILDINEKSSPEQILQKLDETLDLQNLSEKCRTSGKPLVINELPYDSNILQLFLSPVRVKDSKKTLGVVMLLEDVTEEKIMQRSKDEFFSIASHELRTPLTAIRGNTSMMKQYYPEQIKDTGLHAMVDDIHDSSIRLIDIVNDFLDASRLEQKKMLLKQSPVDMAEIVESVIYEMGVVSKEKKIYLKSNNYTLGKLSPVYADKDRLKQIIYNLLGNAMKFTEKGGVTISAIQEGKYVKVSVADTGRGISPEGQKLLFHKFQQTGDSLLTRDTTRGTGLGLYISKLLVEQMGGSIGLEKSVEGAGSTFFFTVPTATKAQLTPKEKVKDSP